MATHLYPLANDDKCSVFELDGTAAVWRVQRMTGKKGRQETLFNENDEPLEIPIESKAADLRNALIRADHTPAGHFKLIPCDKSRATVGEKFAYTKLRGEGGGVDEEERTGGGASDVALVRIAEQLARNNEKMTAALAERENETQKTIRVMVEQMGKQQEQMAKQQAELFRAIGAGAIPVADVAAPVEQLPDDEPEPDMFQKVQQVMPILLQLADFWRNATQQQGAGAAPSAPPPNGNGNGSGFGIPHAEAAPVVG
jgi:hypothetical protein